MQSKDVSWGRMALPIRLNGNSIANEIEKGCTEGWELHWVRHGSNLNPVFMLPGFTGGDGKVCTPFVSIAAWKLDGAFEWKAVENALSPQSVRNAGITEAIRSVVSEWEKVELLGRFELNGAAMRADIKYFFSGSKDDRYMVSVNSALPESVEAPFQFSTGQWLADSLHACDSGEG